MALHIFKSGFCTSSTLGKWMGAVLPCHEHEEWIFDDKTLTLTHYEDGSPTESWKYNDVPSFEEELFNEYENR